MKVLIFPGLGSGHYTPDMLKAIEGATNFIRSRVGKVVEVVEASEVRYMDYDDWNEFTNELNVKRGTIIGIKGGYKDEPEVINYYTWCKDTVSVVVMQIVDVDTSKPWRIGEYDGSEWIEYFNEPEIIDKEINYAQWGW